MQRCARVRVFTKWCGGTWCECRAIAGGAAFVFAQRRRKAYELQVALGEWHEGVIVFPSGDLVGEPAYDTSRAPLWWAGVQG